jgi:hypothetical protein
MTAARVRDNDARDMQTEKEKGEGLNRRGCSPTCSTPTSLGRDGDAGEEAERALAAETMYLRRILGSGSV